MAKLPKKRKVVLSIILVFLFLPVAFHAFIKSPAVQTYLTKKATDFLSEELNTEVRVGGVDVAFFLDLVLTEVYIADKKDNSLLYFDKLQANIEKLSLTQKKIFINKISIHTPYIGLRKYKGEKQINLQFILDYLSADPTTETKEGEDWKLICYSVDIKNARLLYHDHNKTRKEEGIDFSNIDLDEFNMDISEIYYLGDTNLLKLNNLSFKERSGFTLEEFSTGIALFPKEAHINDFKLVTTNTNVKFDLHSKYKNLDTLLAGKGLEDIKVKFDLKPSKVDLKELSYIVPSLQGMDDHVYIAADIRGKMSNFRAKKFEMYYGRSTRLKTDFFVNGLPDIEDTYVNFSIDRFITTASDLSNVKLPKGKPLLLPKEIVNLGSIKYNGNITGFINDFVARGKLMTKLGNVTTNLKISQSNNFKTIYYSGNIAVDRFQLGKYFNNDQLGSITMNTTIKGHGHDPKNMNAQLETNIAEADFKGYNYKNINIEAGYQLQNLQSTITIDDENLDLFLQSTVNMSDSINDIQLDARLKKADLAKLNLLNRDTSLPVRINIKGDLRGSDPENLNGSITLSDFFYKEKGNKLVINHLKMITKSDSSKHKHIEVESELLDLLVYGNFTYKSIPKAISEVASHFIPALPINDSILLDNNTFDHESIHFKLVLEKSNQILQMFAPGIELAGNSKISGSLIPGKNNLELKGGFDKISHKKSQLKGFNFSSNTKNDSIHFDFLVDKLSVSDSIWFDNFRFYTSTKANTSNFNITWDNIDTTRKNKADINGTAILDSLPGIKLLFAKSEIIINDTLWRINDNNHIIYDSTKIALENFKVYNNSQHLLINGVVSHNPKDELHVDLSNFNISNFDVITQKKKMDFDGLFTGNLSLANLYQSPYITSDIFINNFGFNDDYIGDLTVNSIWDNNKKAFKVGANIIYRGNIGSDSTMKLNGFFYPQRENENFDLDVLLNNFKLSILEKYIASFSSDLTGIANGELHIGGTLKKPFLEGDLRLTVRRFKLDYLNESYHFSDVLKIRKGHIEFDSIYIYDVNGNKALCDGKMYHEHFKNFKLDLDLKPQNFEALNTNSYQNELFYGKAYTSGIIKIKGPAKNINLNINANTEKGTRIFIPISSTEEVSENEFVYFVKSDTAKKKTTEQIRKDINISGLSLNFDLRVDPDAEIQIILDEKAGDIIKARGNANLNMGISSLGDFTMHGEYVIEEGDYLFTLENIINKRFSIEKGGSIQWNGDPYNATIDLKAIYNIRASLYDLQLADSSRKRVPVECVILMKDNLFNPDIAFDIQLPGLDDEFLKNQVREIIEPNINKQFLYLLVMNRFLPPDQGAESARRPGIGIGSNSMELLSNQFSNWLSQISNDFDVGFNYQPGDEISSEEVNVALTTQLFNDRVTIDGNLGYEGSSPAQQQEENANNIVGDVKVEYKWTDRFRVKAFNRSNTYDILNNNAPYTQGVGIIYRKEFDRFGELFKKRKQKEKEKALSN